MGIVYLIRHGQRFPVKDSSHLRAAFGDEPVVPGELTEIGRRTMHQLGVTFRRVPIVKAKFSGNRRCEDSLTEFLNGAECSVDAEHLGDINYKGFNEFIKKCDTRRVAEAIKSSIRNPKALDEIKQKYLPDLEENFFRDVASGAIVDSLSILCDRGAQNMTVDLAGLDLDFATALSLGLRSCFDEALRKTILEGFENHDGHTVTVASDIHLLYVLQRVAPQLVAKRPPFCCVLKMTPSGDEVVVEYLDQKVHIPLAEFRYRIEQDVPSLPP